MKAMHPFGCFPVLVKELEMIRNEYPFHHEHASLGLDLSPRLGREPSF
jgi:hypothetical protein